MKLRACVPLVFILPALVACSAASSVEESVVSDQGSAALTPLTTCGAAQLTALVPSGTGREQSNPLTCGADGLWRGRINPVSYFSSFRLENESLQHWGDTQRQGSLAVNGDSIQLDGPGPYDLLVDLAGKSYHVIRSSTPTVLVGAGATLAGTTVAGGKLAVDYDVSKLSSCMTYTSGIPAWGTSVVATFAPSGAQVSAEVLARDAADPHKLVKLIPQLDVPANATSVSLKFVSRNNQGCAETDDNRGKGYLVPVAASSLTRRTVVFIYGVTQPGQDMFIRGGLDHGQMARLLGRQCTADNKQCAIRIAHRNLKNATTAPWKAGDTFLDWYGSEATQSPAAQGTPLDWTTNEWPSAWGARRTVFVDGYGAEPLNASGGHYWMLDVDMDCRDGWRTSPYDPTSWFEVKSFISNGPGWESDVRQADAPYVSWNHFAKCGMVNVFRRGDSSVAYAPLP